MVIKSAMLSIVTSLPLRGAWIEIISCKILLIFASGRSPCGERGLKSLYTCRIRVDSLSLPLRGAWIEILS